MINIKEDAAEIAVLTALLTAASFILTIAVMILQQSDPEYPALIQYGYTVGFGGICVGGLVTVLLMIISTVFSAKSGE